MSTLKVAQSSGCFHEEVLFRRCAPEKHRALLWLMLSILSSQERQVYIQILSH